MVLAIIGLITAVALVNQSTFNKTLILSNTAYDIALTIRSTQSLGLGTRAVGASPNVGYGVRFDKAAPKTIKVFADTHDIGGASCTGQTPACTSGDRLYTSDSDTLVQTYTLGNGISVSKFCVIGGNCSDGSLEALDIAFVRPNADTFVNGNAAASACLTVTSPQGVSRYVSVGPSGLITATASSCP